VRQVVWNLATNGLRAMPNGGTLTLSAVPDDKHLGGVLTVTDEGVGIPHDEIEDLFQPFRGTFGKGSGLGLAIVHRIASDYNAAIDVQSEPGQGTTFRVTFPPAAQRATLAS
jgi:signal transduction histidine kinase